MEQYFTAKIDELDCKIEAWNNKFFFQKLFAKEKWSEEKTLEEIEKIFNLGVLENINSNDDFNIYLKYFKEYNNALSDELSISIVERLLKYDYLNPKAENLLKKFLNAKKASQSYNRRTMDLINSIK